MIIKKIKANVIHYMGANLDVKMSRPGANSDTVAASIL